MQDLSDPTRAGDRRARERLRAEVLAGLRGEPKTLPCKYFYDARGARLFEEICGLDEYYLTRAELEIMERSVGAMAAHCGANAFMIEYGSGSGQKTRLLLSRLVDPVAYVPVDISGEQLDETAARLESEFPGLPVLPVCADYTHPFSLPAAPRPPGRRVAYFPGSTVGNFDPPQAHAFFAEVARVCEAGGGFLVGVDLAKDRAVLEAAYNDAAGVTAAFNLNLLAHVNRALGTDFRLDRFRHFARYDEAESRIEMHLESLERQRVQVGDETFELGPGETICTEYSYKYSLERFAALARETGFEVAEVWLDARAYFSVQYLRVR